MSNLSNLLGPSGVVPTSRTVTGGTGLTGGGALSSNQALSIDAASSSNIRSGAANKVLTSDNVEDAGGEVTLTDATTIAVDWDAFVHATVTLSTNRTLGNPTNVQAGTWRVIRVQTSNDTLSFGANYTFPGASAPDTAVTGDCYLFLYAVSTSEIAVFSSLDVS